MIQITDAVKQLIIVNIILFVGAWIVPELNYYFALYYPENPNFKIWQIITHMFMHGGLMHILFNMFALYSFGSILENIWGSKKFILFYILCGLGSAFLYTAVNYWQFHDAYNTLIAEGVTQLDINHLLENGRGVIYSNDVVQSLSSSYNSVAVGASGAIYGLLVAFAFMFPNAGLSLIFVPVPIKAKYFVPIILAYDLFSGLNGSSIFGFGTGIAHFAHIGGALVGFLLMWMWKKKQFDQYRWDK